MKKKVITQYICTLCGATFTAEEDCYNHEISHECVTDYEVIYKPYRKSPDVIQVTFDNGNVGWFKRCWFNDSASWLTTDKEPQTGQLILLARKDKEKRTDNAMNYTIQKYTGDFDDYTYWCPIPELP